MMGGMVMTPASATEAAAVAMIKRAAKESFMFVGDLFQKNAIILGSMNFGGKSLACIVTFHLFGYRPFIYPNR